MEHDFIIDNEGRDPKKFVTVARADGTFATLVHAPDDTEQSHDHLMIGLLAAEELAKIGIDKAVQGLREHAHLCMGGGRFDEGNVLWGSSTLTNALGRNQPDDHALAEKLIGDVRAWFERTMAVEAK